MRIIEVDDPVTIAALLRRDPTRSPGLHHSTIVGDICKKLEPERFGGDIRPEFIGMGLAFEDVLGPAIRRVVGPSGYRPGEFSSGGIAMSPDWLSDEDLDYYTAEFQRAGFRGGINYYRNGSRNWDLTPQLAGARISQPALFLAGDLDIVNRGASQEELASRMEANYDDLRGVILLPGIGHRVQQQAPEDSNRILIEFLDGLELINN